MTTTEFSPGAEVCTATIHQPQETGEAYSGPLHVGDYPAEPKQDPKTHELWIEQEGRRVQVYAKNLPALFRQLKRAHALAKETAQ